MIGPEEIIQLGSYSGYSIGLGWDNEEEVPINGDLIAVVFDENNQVVDTISGYEGHQVFGNGAISHSGDCRSGGEGNRGGSV